MPKLLLLAYAMMKKITCICFLYGSFLFGQNSPKERFANYFSPEFLLGISAPANDFFPETSLQAGYYFHFGKYQNTNNAEWAYRLDGPKTGIAFGFSTLGNSTSIGLHYSLLPYSEFKLFDIAEKPFNLNIGLGVAYFNKQYNEQTNPFNQAVATDFTWSFRIFPTYTFYQSQNLDLRVGVGYFHQSNGHTKLPNQGLNSFLGSLAADVKYNPEQSKEKPVFKRNTNSYFSLRTGIGENVLALAFNDKREVYTAAFSFGKIINKTFKLGVGAYYRFYEHYYDYIANNESLVQEGKEFEDLKDDAFWNASNIGLFVEGEIIMNHVAFEITLGGNLHKPAYNFDWRINEGWDNAPRDIPETWVLGEYTTKFKLKKHIFSRLGLKYYLLAMEKQPVHNVFLSANINGNLGQADFSELSLGYVYSFNFKG